MLTEYFRLISPSSIQIRSWRHCNRNILQSNSFIRKVVLYDIIDCHSRANLLVVFPSSVTSDSSGSIFFALLLLCKVNRVISAVSFGIVPFLNNFAALTGRCLITTMILCAMMMRIMGLYLHIFNTSL